MWLVWLCACFHREVITKQAMLTAPEECRACTSSLCSPKPPHHSPHLTSPHFQPSPLTNHQEDSTLNKVRHKVHHDIFTGASDLQTRQLLIYVMFLLFYLETYFNSRKYSKYFINKIILQFFWLGETQSKNPQLPTGRTIPVTGKLTVCVCWLEPSVDSVTPQTVLELCRTHGPSGWILAHTYQNTA